MTLRIGLISDTHGLVRPEALAALQGCGVLLHAGDIGTLDVLDTLEGLAPVHAVRGNVDRDPAFEAIPASLDLSLGGLRIHMVHRPQDVTEAAAGTADLIVCGHSHKPLVGTLHGTAHVNPGSAGPRRFSLPVSVAIVEVRDGVPHPRLLMLDTTGGRVPA
jgi:putative phosphoesterase